MDDGFAMVIAALDRQVADQADDIFGAIPVEFHGFFAVRTAHARPLVPPFFRSLRAASITLAPRSWTRSRISNSLGPSSSLSLLDISRRFICKTSSRVRTMIWSVNRWA